jgi:hypothetical protein
MPHFLGHNGLEICTWPSSVQSSWEHSTLAKREYSGFPSIGVLKTDILELVAIFISL